MYDSYRTHLSGEHASPQRAVAPVGCRLAAGKDACFVHVLENVLGPVRTVRFKVDILLQLRKHIL